MPGKPAVLGQIDAGRDRGVRRRMEKQKLGDPQPQDIVNAGDTRRQRAGKAAGDQIVDLAEPAQHSRDQQPRKGAVALRQLRHRRIVVDRLVERPLAAEHRADQVDSNMAGCRCWRHD